MEKFYPPFQEHAWFDEKGNPWIVKGFQGCSYVIEDVFDDDDMLKIAEKYKTKVCRYNDSEIPEYMDLELEELHGF